MCLNGSLQTNYHQTSKTKYVIFRKKSMNIDEAPPLMIGNEYVDRIGYGCEEESFKFVGMHLDEFITWEIHINKLCKKIASANFALNSIKRYLPLRIRKLVYNSLIRCHLEYGILAYGGAKCKEMSQLFKLQKKAVRTVATKSYKAHTDPIFGQLYFLKLPDLYKLNAAHFMYLHNKSRLPVSFDKLFNQLNLPNRTNCYKLEKTLYKCLECFPKPLFPKIWNNLELDLKNKSSPGTFKASLIQKIILYYLSYECKTKECFACDNLRAHSA